MDVRTLCLGILTQGEASGYQIKKAIEEHLGYFLEVSHSSIYPALAELHKEGLVSCEPVRQSGKPDKKVYSLTEAGRTALTEGLLRSPGRHRVRSEFLPLLLFAEYLPHERIKDLINERLTEFEQFKAVAASCVHADDRELPPGLRFVAGLELAALGAVCDYLRDNRDWLEAASAKPNNNGGTS